MAIITTAIKGAKFIPFLFKYWYVWVTLVFILPTVINSIQDAHQQQDYSIVIKEIGGLVASSDNELYKNLETFELEKEEPVNTADKINYYSTLFWKLGKIAFLPIWMMFFLFTILYKVILLLSGNDSAKLGAGIISVFIIAILQAFVGKVPFRGLALLGQTMWGLI